MVFVCYGIVITTPIRLRVDYALIRKKRKDQGTNGSESYYRVCRRHERMHGVCDYSSEKTVLPRRTETSTFAFVTAHSTRATYSM